MNLQRSRVVAESQIGDGLSIDFNCHDSMRRLRDDDVDDERLGRSNLGVIWSPSVADVTENKILLNESIFTDDSEDIFASNLGVVVPGTKATVCGKTEARGGPERRKRWLLSPAGGQPAETAERKRRLITSPTSLAFEFLELFD